MSFTRIAYDICDYTKRLNEGTSILTYILDPIRYYHPKPYRIPFGVVGGNNVSISKHNLVDLENDLFNMNRVFSRCPRHKFLPNSLCEDKIHLPERDMVKFNPRINSTGIILNYPEFNNLYQFGGKKNKKNKKIKKQKK